MPSLNMFLVLGSLFKYTEYKCGECLSQNYHEL